MGKKKKTKYLELSSCESAQFRRKRKPSKESSQAGGLVSSSVSRNTDELVKLLLDCVEQIPALTDQLAQNILGNEATEKKSVEITNIDFENCSENCVQNTNKTTKHVETQNSVQANREPPKDDKAVEAKNRSVDTMKCALRLVEACCDKCTIDNVLQIPQEVKYEVRAATERLQKLLNDLSAEALKAITDCLRQAIASASEYATETYNPSPSNASNGHDDRKQHSPSKSSKVVSGVADSSSPQERNYNDEAASDKKKSGGSFKVTISVISMTGLEEEDGAEKQTTNQPSESKEDEVKNNKSQNSLTPKQNSSKKSLKESKVDKSRSQDRSDLSLHSDQNSSKKSPKKEKSKEKAIKTKNEKTSKKDKSGKDGTKKESQVSMVFDKEQNAAITPKDSMLENQTDDEKLDQNHESLSSSKRKPNKETENKSDLSIKKSKSKLKNSGSGKSGHSVEKEESRHKSREVEDQDKVKDAKTKGGKDVKNTKEEKSDNNMQSRPSITPSPNFETSTSSNLDAKKSRCCESSPQACKQSHDTSKCKINDNHSDESNEAFKSHQDTDDHTYGKPRGTQDKSPSPSKFSADTRDKKRSDVGEATEKPPKMSSVHIESSYDTNVSRTTIIITDSADSKHKENKIQSGPGSDSRSSRGRSEDSKPSHSRNKRSSGQKEAEKTNIAPNQDSKHQQQGAYESRSQYYPSKSSEAVTDLGRQSRDPRDSYTSASEGSKQRGDKAKSHSTSSMASSTTTSCDKCSGHKKKKGKSNDLDDQKTKGRKEPTSSNQSVSSTTSNSTSCKKCSKKKQDKKHSKDRRGSVSSNNSFSTISSDSCKQSNKNKDKKRRSKEHSSGRAIGTASTCSCSKNSSNQRRETTSNQSQDSDSSICFCQGGSSGVNFLSDLIRAIEDFLRDRCFRIFFGPSLDESAIAFYETYPLLPTAASNARNRLRYMFSDEEES
nr:unnamed protein product [Callosobruchus analis]